MFGQHKWLWDVLGGGGLLVALFVVFLLNLGSAPEEVAFRNTLAVDVIDSENNGPDGKLKLAVTQAERLNGAMTLWDDMGRLLEELGEGYEYTSITTDQIARDPQLLEGFDVVFLTCAPNTGPEISGMLRDYVARGGTLYASDYRFDILKNSFRDMVSHGHIDQGKGRQQVRATVKDASLQEALGHDHINLNFDLDGWKTAAFGGPRVDVLLEGSYRSVRGDFKTAPLLVRFQFDKGTVIFTSFHNEKQNRAEETKLLHYLVFSLVNAEVDAMVNAKIQEGGFAPQKSNLLSTPKNQPSITKTYQHDSGKALRFALGFRNEGAKLRFKITAPDGKAYQWQGGSTVILDVPDAPTGEWTYEVTAVDLPYPNFPFTVTVGEKE